MAEVPRRIITAIQRAGIDLVPDHPSFQTVAREVWGVVEERATEVHLVMGGRRDRIVNLLIVEVGLVRHSVSYKHTRPEKITDSILSFRVAIRRKAADIITERNHRISGEVEPPLLLVHGRKQIRRLGGEVVLILKIVL